MSTMKTRFTWLGVVATLLVTISTFFVACNKDDMNDVIVYHGQVVYINTTNPFPDLTVKVTNGKDTHCQTQTDAGGLFSLKVRVNEIDGEYYLLAGDSTCIPKKVGLGGYGQAEVDLGVIEVEGPSKPTVKTTPIQSLKADEVIMGGEVMTDGRLRVTARGICYGPDPYPTVDGLHTTDGAGLGAFTSTLKNLEYNTIYYARAYATNKMGTAYDTLQIKFTTEEGVAVVVTDSVIRITAHSAKCKGKVVSDGGFSVTKRGTCWSKRPDPTVDDDCTDDGSGIGEFTSTMKDLTENTTYYVRTYATNSTKTTYGEQIIITTLDGLAVVKTDSITSVTATGFTAYGTVVSDCDIAVTERGFCYSTSQYPTTENKRTPVSKGLGSFHATISGLEYGTTYYVRAYAINATATTYDSIQYEITTRTGLPSVVTDSVVTNIGSVKATCGGKVTDDGTLTVTARGICYSTEPQPTTEDTHTTEGKGKGEFVSNLKNLQDKTTYYFRAYATTDAGTAYGKVYSFKTSDGIPVVVLSQIGEPTANSVSCTGNVTGDGGLTVSERGFCYSVSQYPTNTDAHVVIGSGMGEFTGSLTGLNVNTTYYVRAYAVNSIGVGYSEQRIITTQDGLAKVTTAEATSTATSISTGGNVTSNGGYAVTERGVCYSITNVLPTITDEKVLGGSGNGGYNVSITGLSANTTYHIRAYAINENGIAYGAPISIQTKSGNASVLLDNITNITALTATASVTVTDAGSATLQSCGICWSTNPTPTISDSKTAATGKALNTAYPCNMSELQPGTTYYVRAYATTNVATTYSDQKTFTTKTGAAEVTLGSIANITALTASGIVTITDANGATLQSCGICWATTPNPTIVNQKTVASGKVVNTAYTCNLSSLNPSTVYYVRAYATTDIATSYSPQRTFTTASGLPELTTMQPTATSVKISAGGNITSDGGYPITARGLCYSTNNSEPTLSDAFTSSGTGSGAFTSIITNVSVSTTYYVRAYATNSIGTSYGHVYSVTTGNGMPSVTTTVIGENVTSTTATGGGNVTDDGGYAVTARGVCWSTLPNPTIADSKTVNGGGKGYFTSTITGIDLTENNTYYVRAYATNANGTVYGESVKISKENLDYANLPTLQYAGYTYKLYPDMGIMTWDNAMSACDALSFGGYDDWYLPSPDEIQACYLATKDIEGWKTNVVNNQAPYYIEVKGQYWTSEEYGSWGAVTFNIVIRQVSGEAQQKYTEMDQFSRDSSQRVRAVRKYIAQ